MKQTLKHTRIFFILQLIFVAFGLLSILVPNKLVRNNIERSIDRYEHEGIYPRPFINEYSHQSDLFMDYMIMDIIYNNNSSKPFEQLLLPKLNFKEIKDQGAQNVLYSIAHKHEVPDQTYGRYWQGGSYFYKFLFAGVSISGVRWLNYLLVSVTLFALFFKLGKSISRQNTFLLFLSLVFVNYYMIYCSMQFTPVFIIAFIGSIVLINKNQANKPLGALFLIIGGLTSYFDLLTVPIITLGIPLLIWALMLTSVDKIMDRVKTSIGYSLLWSAGYFLTWFFKWILVWLFTNYSIINEVKEKLELRSGVFEQRTRWDAIVGNLQMINVLPFILIVLILIGLMLIFFNRKGINRAILLLILSFLPILWFVITANHVDEHSWFTYRSLWVSIAGLFLAFSSVIRWEDIKIPWVQKQFKKLS